MKLKEIIEQYKECTECMKKSNYPKEWLDKIVVKQKEIFANYSTKEERQPLIAELHQEYRNKFDSEIGEIKIPYEGSLYTLEEAEALLSTIDVVTEVTTEYNEEKIIAKRYLADTDFYMTVDKYETLTVERQEELKAKRAEARVTINELEG